MVVGRGVECWVEEGMSSGWIWRVWGQGEWSIG
jgi:hypothetical protein